ncbi:carbohydrate ABC transporter permease [Neglectibacter caecimuris]|uniref:carbohydrate ABC transporter permease n=1 Tax=Neglectibacter caecimuris TaxID=3093658 RepID=UPI002AC9E102|nr:carbohydrate ABC transporter permease [Neglectibacter sp. M00184]
MAQKSAVLKKKQLSDILIDLFVYGAIALTVIAAAYPVYFVCIASVSSPTAVSRGEVLLLPKEINFRAYQEVFQDARVWLGYRNTIFYTLAGTALSLVFTIPASFSLSRKELPFRQGLMFFFTFTMFFSGGLIPTYFLMQNLNLVNTVWVMILPFSVSVYNLIVTRTFFQNSIPEDLFEAARIDGCSYTRFLFQIVLPLSKAIIAVIGLYYAVWYWNEYMRALIYVQDKNLIPLQLVLRNILVENQALEGSSLGAESRRQLVDLLKYALIVVSTLPMLILYPLLQKYFEKGVMIGSIKG